ncbi:DUF3899 domain-containing protein [Virgibacillus halodenitrificans]|uniref:DUF3899 domain-containing protein n=1 Tax=Virgibacillus halodenitrificans TaxID=1482 RepID=UPI0024C070FF|nr:DUF3899 domain-containing protein [Virgibacillus halodenitrificans]WHX25901.1 DUF3899 domain-containing protein [Virgibacillus halodenitrificans]
MQLFMNKWFYFLINILVVTLVFFLFTPKYDLENYINTWFYVFLLSLVAILFLFIKKGGFFDGLAFSFRRFGSIMSKKKKDYMGEWKEKPAPSETINTTFYRNLRFLVWMQIVILLLLMTLYYTI